MDSKLPKEERSLGYEGHTNESLNLYETFSSKPTTVNLGGDKSHINNRHSDILNALRPKNRFSASRRWFTSFKTRYHSNYFFRLKLMYLLTKLLQKKLRKDNERFST